MQKTPYLRPCLIFRYTLMPLILAFSLYAPVNAKGFDITVIGATGGLNDGNLSAYLIQPAGDRRGVLCDAGTVLSGIMIALKNEGLRGTPSAILNEQIHGYLISHAHMDHIAGLVAISPEDTPKPIYGLPSVVQDLSLYVFNNHIWPNMGDLGNVPHLKKYHYVTLKAGQPQPIAETAMHVTAYPLDHGAVESSAFLIETNESALLYLGDTGPDRKGVSEKLHALWKDITPALQTHRLSGIMLECSYDNTRPDRLLFGHLTPDWFMKEMHDLQNTSGISLKGLHVLVTHIKADIDNPTSSVSRIMTELLKNNDLDLSLTAAQQGEQLHWP